MRVNLTGQLTDYRRTNHGGHGRNILTILLALFLKLVLEGCILGVFACSGCHKEEDYRVVFHGECAR